MAGFTLPEETPESQLGPSTASILRTRDIPWDIYMTARLISDKDLQLLRRYDNKNPGTQARLLAEVRLGLGPSGLGSGPARVGWRGAASQTVHLYVYQHIDAPGRWSLDAWMALFYCWI